METRKILAILFLALGLLLCWAKVGEAAPMGTAFTYQGRLIDANEAADGLYDFQFKLFDDANVVDGNQVGSDVNVADVDVIDGYFTVELDFNEPNSFKGDARWLEICVRPGAQNDPNVYTTLSPRQEATPTPYALFAKTSGSDGDWMISGNDMYSIPSGNVGIGTNAPQTRLEVSGEALVRAGGFTGNAHGAAGGIEVRGAPGTFGPSLALDNGTQQWNIVSWDDNALRFIKATGTTFTPFTIKNNSFHEALVLASNGVGIGTSNPVDLLEVASDSLAGVTLSTYSSAEADNPSELALRRARGTMAAPSAILSGDVIGWIFGDGYGSTTWPDIGPGINFVATENWTDTALGSRIGFYTIRNGTNVEVEAMRIDQSGNVGIGTESPAAKLTVNGAILRQGSTMYGTNANTHINLGTNSTTGRNGLNLMYATVGGGVGNTASDHYDTVAGGYYNTASGYYSTVGGGQDNIAGERATVGGGYRNDANAPRATVGGGYGNTANNFHATVGGGRENTASGYIATIPGGYLNEASGYYSFAAGRRAKANDSGTFVWADSTDANFASTANDQFLIRASGGVGIGVTDPSEDLDVAGTARLRGITAQVGVDYVHVDGNGKLWKTSSSRRYKTNIKDLEMDKDAVLELRPVRYECRSTGKDGIGLIAEEVAKHLPTTGRGQIR
jgi:hypothetical protein